MPIFLRLFTRFLSDRLKGLGAWSLAAFWWLLEWAGDKILGDAAFGWLRDMVSPLSQYAWVALLWTYGIPFGLVGLGAYFFWRAGNSLPREALADTISQPIASETVSAPASQVKQAPKRPEAMSRADALPVLSKPKPAPVIATQSLPDVPDWDWGKLYGRSEDGKLIHLRFLPDTPEAAKHTVLLVVYGYKVIRDLSSVRVGAVHNEIRRAQREAPNARSVHKMQGVLEVMSMLQDVDYGQPAIEAGYLRRVRLSEGGSYELTPYGLVIARSTAWDLIERA